MTQNYPELTMKLRQTWLILFIVWLWVSGCGGPADQLPPQQVVAQVDSQAKQNRFQEQLLKQVAQVSVTDYKDYKVGPEDFVVIEVTFFGNERFIHEKKPYPRKLGYPG